MVTGDLRLEKENICLEKEAGEKMSGAVRREKFSPSIKRKKRRTFFGLRHSSYYSINGRRVNLIL